MSRLLAILLAAAALVGLVTMPVQAKSSNTVEAPFDDVSTRAQECPSVPVVFECATAGEASIDGVFHSEARVENPARLGSRRASRWHSIVARHTLSRPAQLLTVTATVEIDEASATWMQECAGVATGTGSGQSRADVWADLFVSDAATGPLPGNGAGGYRSVASVDTANTSASLGPEVVRLSQTVDTSALTRGATVAAFMTVGAAVDDRVVGLDTGLCRRLAAAVRGKLVSVEFTMQ